MISVRKETRVRKLLKANYTVDEIHKRTGVSRPTIRTIKKLPGLRPRRLAKSKYKKIKKPVRCPKCGGKVTRLPCVLCTPEAGDYDEKAFLSDPKGTVVSVQLAIDTKRLIVDLDRYNKKIGVACDPIIANILQRASEIYARLPGGEPR